MRKKLVGSLLIETIVATAIVVSLAVLVYTSFQEVTAWGVRNRLAGVGLTIIASHVDQDGSRSYTDTQLTPGTQQFTAETSGYSDLGQLTNAVLTRVITEQNGVKTLQYILEWITSGRTQRITSDFQMTAQGVLND